VLACSSGLTVAAVNGVATFSGCTINNAGPGYTLIATATGLSAAISASFDIGLAPPPVPAHLEFAVATVFPPPLTGIAGGALNFIFDVRVVDSNSQLIMTGPQSAASVTLSMAPNPVGATVSCPSGVTVAAVQGVAHFTGCSVSTAGSDLAFIAAAPGLGSTLSFSFNILPQPNSNVPTLTLTASPKVIEWGDTVTLSVHMGPAGGSGGPVGNRKVHIRVATVTAVLAFTTAGDVTTDANGNATFAYTPATNLYYLAVYDGDPDLGPASSAMVRVTVRQIALLRPDNAGKVKTVAKGTLVEFTTVVRPARDDIPRTHVKWQVWRLVNNRWTLFLTQISDPDVSGRAFLRVSFNTGSWYVRSQAMPTQLNANSFWTGIQRYDVK
jgi:hypothetical protein